MTTISRKDAIGIVYEDRKGLKSDLIKKIGEYLYNQFCLMGYIMEGVNPQGPTWHITKSGDENYFFYHQWATPQEAKLSRHLLGSI